MKDLKRYSPQIFDAIRRLTEDGYEFWYARELQEALEYSKWGNFVKVIEKAKQACENSGNDIEDHFAGVGNMVELGSGAQREIEDIMLSRYACYLVVQNGDPRKKVIALGQTYFAVKARESELRDDFEQLPEEQKRLAIRNELIEHNKSLAEAAQMAGVEDPRDYAVFQNKDTKVCTVV